MLLDQIERVKTVHRGSDCEASVPQRIRQHMADSIIVFDDQDAFRQLAGPFSQSRTALRNCKAEFVTVRVQSSNAIGSKRAASVHNLATFRQWQFDIRRRSA